MANSKVIKVIKKVASPHFYITSLFIFIPLLVRKIGTLPNTSDSIFGTLPSIRGMGGRGGGCPTILLGGGDLMRSDFDHLNFFQSEKQHSVHIDYQLKSKLPN